MTKDMFINELRRALAIGFSAQEIETHVKYYSEYIAMEISKGKSEEEILTALGEPRLIAKSILDAKDGGEKKHHEEQNAERRAKRIRKIPSWLFVTLVVIVVLAFLALILRVFIQLLPILLIIVAVVMFVSFIRRIF